LTIDGKTVLGLKLTGTPKSGDSLVTLISTTSGKSASYDVKVGESTRSDVIQLGQPSLAVASEDTYVPVTVTDKNGNSITDPKVLNNATKGVTVTVDGSQVTNTFVTKDNSLFIKVPATTKGLHSLVTQTSTYKVSTLTLDVKDAAKPTLVRGFDSDFASTVRSNSSSATTQALSYTNLVIEDQYGRVMSDDAVNTWLQTAGNAIKVSKVSSNDADLTVSDGTIDASGGAALQAATSAANGQDTFSLALSTTATGTIASSTAEVGVRVTDGNEFKSYVVNDIPTVFDEVGVTPALTNSSDYDVPVKVYGVLNDGSKVLLTAGTDYALSTDNTTLQSDLSDGVINDTTSPVTYGTNETQEVVPVTVTINANGQEFTKNVTFSKVLPKVAKAWVVQGATGATPTVTDSSVSTIALTGNTFSVADVTQSLTNAGNSIVVEDQYGVDKVVTDSTGAAIFGDTAGGSVNQAIGAPTLTITPVDGTVVIAGNGTTAASVTGIDAGESFNVKVTYAGGASTTVKVTR
jgi:trimeric autotransporter adhesin